MKILKKYINSYITILFLLLVSAGLFSSCSDDTTGPTQNTIGFDSARFNWKVDTLYTTIVDLLPFDTSNVFYLAVHDLIYYNGINYSWTPIEFNFTVLTITGYSKNDIYIAGISDDPNTQGKPQIKKWNGTALSEVFINDSTDRRYAIISSYQRNQNEIWFGSDSGRLIKYDGISHFTFYDFDSGMMIKPFLVDENNDLYFVGYKDSIYTGSVTIYIFKWINENWENVYTNTYNSPPINPRNVGNRIIGVHPNVLYQFTNNTFITYLNITQFILLNPIEGNSLTDMLSFGGINRPFPEGGLNIFHYNGKNWSKELPSTNQNSFNDIVTVNNKYICLSGYGSWTPFVSFIYYGKRK